MIKRNVIKKDFRRNKWLYAMAVPFVAYYLIFYYGPMYGALIAFQHYSPMKGIWGSDWAGLEHFRAFVNGFYFWRVVRNTLILNVYSLMFEFTAPILLALLFNEVRIRVFRNVVQTIAYMPYFISMIVVCGLVKELTEAGGLLNLAYTELTGTAGRDMLQNPGLFRGIYVASEIWQRVGWESILYTAALAAVDPGQYEAARMDGAGRLRRMWHVSIPGLMPTIILLFILRMGLMMEVGYEKIILLYSPVTYETADVISTYVYRKGLLDSDWSFSSAVGLMNSVMNLFLLILANSLSRRFSRSSLW